MKTKFLPLVLGTVVVFCAFVAVTSASAAICTGGTVSSDITTPPVAPVEFAVEGGITSICVETDPLAGIEGTITVNGLTFNVPSGLNVNVGDPGCFSADEIAFGALVDPSSLVGATGIASGEIVVDISGSLLE